MILFFAYSIIELYVYSLLRYIFSFLNRYIFYHRKMGKLYATVMYLLEKQTPNIVQPLIFFKKLLLLFLLDLQFKKAQCLNFVLQPKISSQIQLYSGRVQVSQKRR